MPKRTDIKSILIIGAGPIVIGQACEFDYSGVQACKALREEGYRIILVNSNPATIMTDPDMADVTYIEPISWEVLSRIIAREKPDAVLPTMGGQTALNCALDLHRALPGNDRRQRFAGHQLHGDVGFALGHASFVDRADVGMVQRGSGAGLPQQPRTGFVIQMRVVAHHLQGHRPPQLRILRPVDHTHTSGADPF